MFETSKHPSDEEILQFVDHELPTNRLKQLREHLAACSECRERQIAIENRLNALQEFYQAESTDLSALTPSRIYLQDQITKYRKEHLASGSISILHLCLQIVAVTVLVAIGWFFYGGKYVGKFKHEGLSSSEQYIIPNHSVTPGVVRAVSLNEVCSVPDDDLDPQVSPAIEVAVLKEYGISRSAAQKYQIDYLVNPQLGGTNDIKNLWPQSYSNGRWNAHAKDVLERHLYQMVCNGSINLTVAQQEIAENWVAAYKKYVGREDSHLISNQSRN